MLNKYEGQIRRCEERVYSLPEIPSKQKWEEDIYKRIEHFQAVMSDVDACIPYDIAGDKEERWSLFCDLLRQYGELLIHWPEIVHTAQCLEEENRYAFMN